MIALVVSVLSALLTALMGIRYRRLESTLRLDVDTRLHRLRGDIERDLKHQEVRMRVAADFRLKMLEMMLTSAAEFRRALGKFVEAIQVFVHEVEPRGNTQRAQDLLRLAVEAFAALGGAGPFMPVDLLNEATDVANAFKSCLDDIAEWGNLSTRDERTQRCRKTAETLVLVSTRSKNLFGSWQAKQFTQFTRDLDRLGDVDAAIARPTGVATSQQL